MHDLVEIGNGDTQITSVSTNSDLKTISYNESDEKTEKELILQHEASPVTNDTKISSTSLLTSTVTDSASNRSSFHCYIGNLTWWTTVEKVEEALHSIGVKGLILIKFFENPINGVSKGYCMCSVQNKEALELIFSKLGKIQIEGKTPIISSTTEENFKKFEASDTSGGRKIMPSSLLNPIREPPQAHSSQLKTIEVTPNYSSVSGTLQPGRFHPYIGNAGNFHHNSTHVNGYQYQTPLNYYHIPPAPRPPMPFMMDQYGPHHQTHPMGFGFEQYQSERPIFAPRHCVPTHRWPPPAQFSSQPWIPFPPERRSWPPHSQPPIDQYQSPSVTPPLSTSLSSSCSGPPGLSPIAASTPKFHPSPSSTGSHQTELDSERCSSRSDSPKEYRSKESSVNGNRQVTKAAISRAIQNATDGEFDVAIDTLATGMMLVKKSGTANDPRCLILINSMEDTVRAIQEQKSIRMDMKQSRDDRKRYSSISSHHRNGRQRRCSRSRSRSSSIRPLFGEKDISPYHHHRYYKRRSRSRTIRRTRSKSRRRFSRDRRYEEQNIRR